MPTSGAPRLSVNTGSSIALTASTYAVIMPVLKREAAERFERLAVVAQHRQQGARRLAVGSLTDPGEGARVDHLTGHPTVAL